MKLALLLLLTLTLGAALLLTFGSSGATVLPHTKAVETESPLAPRDQTKSDQSVGELQVEVVLGEIDPDLLRRLRGGPGFDPDKAVPASMRRQGLGSLTVTLEDPITGLPLQSEEGQGLLEGVRGFTCPEGPVRVVAMGRPLIESRRGIVMGPRSYGRVEKIVEVKAGTTANVKLEVPIGGVLHVEVVGSLSELDTTRLDEEIARRKQLADYMGPIDLEGVERMFRAQLFIEDPAHHVYEAVPRKASINSIWSSPGSQVVNEWPLGETHTSTMLSPGIYTLRASFPGRLPIETQVTIREGDITKLRLDFGQ